VAFGDSEGVEGKVLSLGGVLSPGKESWFQDVWSVGVRGGEAWEGRDGDGGCLRRWLLRGMFGFRSFVRDRCMARYLMSRDFVAITGWKSLSEDEKYTANCYVTAQLNSRWKQIPPYLLQPRPSTPSPSICPIPHPPCTHCLYAPRPPYLSTVSIFCSTLARCPSHSVNFSQQRFFTAAVVST
jgi:hypothetical protein